MYELRITSSGCVGLIQTTSRRRFDPLKFAQHIVLPTLHSLPTRSMLRQLTAHRLVAPFRHHLSRYQPRTLDTSVHHVCYRRLSTCRTSPPVMASLDSTPVETYRQEFSTSSTEPAAATTESKQPISAALSSSSSSSSTSSQSQSSPQPKATPNIVVHHLNNSRSQRILWLLEELQIPYTITRYQRTSGSLAPPELLSIHPLGKSPVITDNGRTVAESGAIVDYLIDRYGADRMTVTDSDERLSVNYWSHAAEGSYMPPLVMLTVFKAVREKTPWGVRLIASAITHAVEDSYINPTTQKLFELTEKHLTAQRAKGSTYFVGSHLTAADFMMLFPMEGAAASGKAVKLGAESRQWVERVHARDAYKRALQKGGEYAYAKM